MHPLQGGDEVIGARVGGIGVFLPEIGKIKIPQDIQPVIDRNHHRIPQAGHIGAVVGCLLDGGAGFEAAAVEPHQHGALPVIQPRGPDVQVQAVLIHGPVPVGHIQLPVGPVIGQEGADEAVAGGIEDAVPFLHRLRRVEALRFRVGDSFENAQAVLFIAPDRALVRFRKRRGAVPPEGLLHDPSRLFIVLCCRFPFPDGRLLLQ